VIEGACGVQSLQTIFALLAAGLGVALAAVASSLRSVGTHARATVAWTTRRVREGWESTMHRSRRGEKQAGEATDKRRAA